MPEAAQEPKKENLGRIENQEATGEEFSANFARRKQSDNH
jgi:hypothetical protein